MKVLAVLCLLLLVPSLPGEMRKDIEYGRVDDVTLKLDAFVPDGPGPFPTAILVHGGGWEGGDKQTYITYIFEPLSQAGFAWFSIDYRLAPQHPFPAAVDDVRRAIRFVKENAAAYKVDLNRLALIGESAGGHLVSYVGARGDPRTSVNAVVSFYGIHDFVSFVAYHGGTQKNVRQFLEVERLKFDTVAKLIGASPIAFVNASMPPFLFIHGTEDKSVPFQQSVDMCDAMKAKGVACEIIPVAGVHGMDHWEPDPKLHFYKQEMIDWLKKTLR
jgi:acetyl esterase/lipase